MPHTRFCLVFAAVLDLAWMPARAAGQLADSSPFLPAGVTGGTSSDPSALELRGILVGPQGTRYDIYDPAKKSGTWAAVGERGHDFTIRSADPDPSRGRVVVQAAGRTYPLTLKTDRAASLAASAPGVPGNAAAVTPAEQAERLAAVAEEVRRRRQLRDQAAQGAAPGTPDVNGVQGQGRRLRQGGGQPGP